MKKLTTIITAALLATGMSAYAKKPVDQEQYIVALNPENFLLVYSTGKSFEGLEVPTDIATNKSAKIQKIKLPKSLSQGLELDQIINIGNDHIMVLVTVDNSNSNFAYVYSINDLLNGDDSQVSKLKLPNGYNPTITYSSENWKTGTPQFFTYAVTDGKDGASQIQAFLLSTDAKYQKIDTLATLDLPANVKGENLNMATFMKEVSDPQPGHGYRFPAGLVFQINGTDKIGGFLLQPAYTNGVGYSLKLSEQYNVGTGTYPAVADIAKDTNIAMVSSNGNSLNANILNHQLGSEAGVSKYANGGYPSIAAVYGTTSISPYLFETHRASDNSVWLDVFNYLPDGGQPISLNKSIEVYKG
jgi:hypothetical protein